MARSIGAGWIADQTSDRTRQVVLEPDDEALALFNLSRVGSLPLESP
jgi:hypothetical protein